MTDWILEAWPVNEDGEPEEDVLLGNESDLASGEGVCTSFLEECGIPYLARCPEGAGEETPAGVDIYVPASMLEHARDLINGAEHIIYEEDEEDLLL